MPSGRRASMMQTRASCSGTAFLGIFLGKRAQYGIIFATGVDCGLFVNSAVVSSCSGSDGAVFGLDGALEVK